MALGARELYEEGDEIRRDQRVEAKTIIVGTLAVYGSADHELPILTPMAFNTNLNQWVPWDANGANDSDTVRGFLFPDAAVLDDTDQCLAQILIEGKIHYDDILEAVEERAVEVEADLETELKSGPRDKGLIILGLAGVR